MKQSKDVIMNDEQYEQMLLAAEKYNSETRRAIKDQFNEMQEKRTTSSMKDIRIFQLLKDHIKATEHDIPNIIPSLKFGSFRNGTLHVRVLDKTMRQVLLTYTKSQEWALALKQYGVREIFLLP